MLSRLRRWLTPPPDQAQLIDTLRRRVAALEATATADARDRTAARQEHDRLLRAVADAQDQARRDRTLLERIHYRLHRDIQTATPPEEQTPSYYVSMRRDDVTDLLARIEKVLSS